MVVVVSFRVTVVVACREVIEQQSVVRGKEV